MSKIRVISEASLPWVPVFLVPISQEDEGNHVGLVSVLRAICYLDCLRKDPGSKYSFDFRY